LPESRGFYSGKHIQPVIHFRSMGIDYIARKNKRIKILFIDQVNSVFYFFGIVKTTAVDIGDMHQGKTIEFVRQFLKKKLLANHFEIIPALKDSVNQRRKRNGRHPQSQSAQYPPSPRQESG